MLAQADRNDLCSLSKQHENTQMTGSMVHFQRFEDRTPLEFFGASGTRNTGHLRLGPNLQQALGAGMAQW